ncbi:hypothetical protein A3K80_08220 [Candidatus Bathyarchaeota archaeon RBG_13_38_9]|nr:MAG: hypothetical protein A3K80_08220 [Candidatus Bathyarchaeota archaeon RBG_13_38_9]
MSESNAKGWFAKHTESEAKKDVMKLSERTGELIGIFCILILIIFFITHQTSSTGFFTSKFGRLEQFLLYGSLSFGIITSIGKIIVGRKNVIRPLEAFGALFSFIALLWLLDVFPFDFTHLTDILPEILRLITIWISNDIAKIFMIIGIVGSFVTAIYIIAPYVSILRLDKPN